MRKKQSPTSRTDNEKVNYENAPTEAKSFLVQVLHWHRFRPQTLKNSWTKEEPLTWELFRALDLLLRRMFLARFLRAVAACETSAAKAVAALTHSPDDVVVEPFPLLRLPGNKAKRRADIGFGLSDGPRLWIEVKVRGGDVGSLRRQLDDERKALRDISPHEPTAVVAVAPHSLVETLPDALSWGRVCDCLTDGLADLSHPELPRDIVSGYQRLATELLHRVQCHAPTLVA